MDPLFWLALTTLLLTVLLAAELLRGERRLPALRAIPPTPGTPAPAVSIVVAARDEARHIEAALTSLLRLDYPDYEVLVVDDRSSDATGAILARLAASEPRLRPLTVATLPPDWLGKNHALWLGAGAARGELLLFTDADIVMAPDVLARAVTLLQRERLDHLALTPRMVLPGTLLPIFGLGFIFFFSLFARPWQARNPASRCHIGIGAFNLVRTAAYRAVGGHEAIRLRPDDDLKLGKLLKMAGYRQDLAFAPEFLAVEWYASVGEAVRGLEKNAFAGTDYRIWLALAGVAFHLVCSVWPYAALLLTAGSTRWLNAGVVALLTALLVQVARRHRANPWHALGFPLAALLFCWIVLRTMTLNLSEGGIRWRGTFYPLDRLKKNRI